MKKGLIGILCLVCAVAQAERKFFVFDNGLQDVRSSEDQAKLLKKLGYDGICTRPAKCTPKLLAAFDKHKVTVAISYVTLGANSKTIPANIVTHIESLKGRETMIWLALTDANAPDKNAVSVIRQVCKLAKANGLETVLYPHVNFRTDTIARTEHLRKLADCPGLGISFNLCHFLAQNDPGKLDETLRSIAQNLKLVLLSGANRLDAPKPDWSQLILPLGEGNFDMHRVFQTLKEIAYDGPVALQCYQVPGPAATHLSKSMNAWRGYNNRHKNYSTQP